MRWIVPSKASLTSWQQGTDRSRPVEWLTPALVRVVLGGPGLERVLRCPRTTDTYVNLAILLAGAPDHAVFEASGRARGAPRGRVAGPPPLHRALLGRGESDA